MKIRGAEDKNRMGDSKFAEMCALAAKLKDKQEPEVAFHLLLFQQQTVEMCEARWKEERDKLEAKYRDENKNVEARWMDRYDKAQLKVCSNICEQVK